MKKNAKKATIWLIIIGLIATGIVFFATRPSIVEEVKKGTAKLFVYEYIPNQKVQIDSCLVSQSSDSIYKDFRKNTVFIIRPLAWHLSATAAVC